LPGLYLRSFLKYSLRLTQHISCHTPPRSAQSIQRTPTQQQRIIAERRLAIDFFDDDLDECYDADEDKYGKCDLDRFPRCGNDELICYNRTNRRDKFYSDWHPRFFINYHRVLCYPASWEGWGGCSSCSPGRYCKHEKRCILDEQKYCCEGEWGCDGNQEDEE
jgi:hypothetical protein